MGKKIIGRIVEDIAKRHLGIETLATRNSDCLDFTECSVWGLKAALEAAFKAGVEEERLAVREYYGDRD